MVERRCHVDFRHRHDKAKGTLGVGAIEPKVEADEILGENQGHSPLASRLFLATMRAAPAGDPSTAFDDRFGRSL